MGMVAELISLILVLSVFWFYYKLSNKIQDNPKSKPMVKCYIPARYPSSRLPGKPLLMINNKTIINHVWDRVQSCKNIDDCIILTDDKRIYNEVLKFGGKCAIITDECLNGTDRIIKYLKKSLNKKFDVDHDDDIIVNVQGDEPFINPKHIDLCIENYIVKKKMFDDLRCGTLHYSINDAKVSADNDDKDNQILLSRIKINQLVNLFWIKIITFYIVVVI